ncbi:TlpA family protein disulfide reductase [Natrinema soli]|uniref:TlpA family protein disulfide reductase n=1 Tax=Natrinema soli TaxID=1930624 RepID=A0ABD5SKK2_9EURY|nr:TlpA disulfide reductase family protein [Natrinema soli]
MRRREIIAGLGSVGVLAGAGGLFLGGVPSFGAVPSFEADSTESEHEGGSDGPITVETIDAPGSEAGTVTVPNGDVMVVELFVTGCGNCQAQMSNLAEAHSQLAADYGDGLTFLGATYQSNDSKPPAELRDWWRGHGGNWPVGYDPTGDISARYGAVGYPVTMVIDERGEKRWEELGFAPPETIVEAVEPVLEANDGTTTNESTTPGANESQTA